LGLPADAIADRTPPGDCHKMRQATGRTRDYNSFCHAGQCLICERAAHTPF